MITEFCRLLSLLVVFIVCLPAVAERLILASLSCDGIQGFEASIGDDGSTSREGVLAYLPRLVFIEGHSSHTPPNGNTWDLPGLIRVEITHGGTLTAEGTRLRRVVCPNGLIGWQIVDAMQFEILGTEKQGIRTGISDNRISDEQLMREVAVITNGTHTWVLAVSGLLCECTDIKSRPVFIPARVFLWQLHGTSIDSAFECAVPHMKRVPRAYFPLPLDAELYFVEIYDSSGRDSRIETRHIDVLYGLRSQGASEHLQSFAKMRNSIEEAICHLPRSNEVGLLWPMANEVIQRSNPVGAHVKIVSTSTLKVTDLEKRPLTIQLANVGDPLLITCEKDSSRLVLRRQKTDNKYQSP